MTLPDPRDPARHRARFGPLEGDRVRVGDTDLWLRVSEDRQATWDRPTWGYGGDLRLRMTQRDRVGLSQLDTVICGALVVDPSIGVLKADIGIKDGRIVGVGRAGNPDLTDGVDLEIGPHTEPIMGYGLVATPGAVDSHVHMITPALLPAALSGGVTTLLTAGFEEPPWAMERTLRSMEGWPLNIGLQANARGLNADSLEPLLEAGAVGFKVHEDYGAYPDLIDAVLRFAEAEDVAVSLHTDGLHEAAELEETVAAIAGRTVHAYHVEGAGGGHVPDLIGLVREPNILCSSTTPTVPFGVGAAREHLPMILLNHGGDPRIPEQVALMAERIHPATMAAEGPLHELGAISIVNSDSQGMGRIAETVRRTVQLAHVMKEWRTTAAGAGHPGLSDQVTSGDDNERILRYLAKVTIEPAIAHGISEHVGSLLPGRLADIVLWKPAYLGAKPELVLKGGYPAWGALGEGNAAVEWSEPTRYRGHWGAGITAAPRISITFVSGRASTADLARGLDTARDLVPVHGTRGLRREDLRWNRTTVPVEIDPTTGTVTLAGRVLAVDPVRELPLNRLYWLR